MVITFRDSAIQMSIAAVAAVLFPYPALHVLPLVFETPFSPWVETINNLVVLGMAFYGVYLAWQAIGLWRKWYDWRRRYQQFRKLRA